MMNEHNDAMNNNDNNVTCCGQTSEKTPQSQRRWMVYAPLLALLVLAFALSSCGGHALVGQNAPAFYLPTLEDADKTVALSDHAGQDIVVLDFWASWCPPCRDGLPILDSIAQEYADQNVVVYAINIKEPAETVRNFVSNTNLQLPVLMDDYGEIANAYQVHGIPQTVIIDREGRVRDVHVGVGMGFRSAIERQLDALIAE